jgi:putative molybdopterin biosynthesis protein
MNGIQTALRSLARQEQFLDLVDRDAATARFHRHIELRPLGAETVPLSQALGRVLACAVIADVDVPGFDRAVSTGSRCMPTIRWAPPNAHRKRWR